jgi:cyanophycinase-like exopeptidase
MCTPAIWRSTVAAKNAWTMEQGGYEILAGAMSRILFRSMAVLMMTAGSIDVSAFQVWMTGDPADVSTKTSGGTVLMGGGSDVTEAFRWMTARSGGGDFVVIRASGSNGYNTWVYETVGGVNSVETILFESRSESSDTQLVNKIRNAEALWIAGGDQSDYVNYWKGTPVQDAINYLITVKKAPVGGTSAGCAIMTPIYTYGGATSDEALANPYNSGVVLGRNDFLAAPFLDNTVADMHYLTRARQGRHVVFMARMVKDWGISDVKGIASDEATAVCVDTAGRAFVFGGSKSFFLRRYCSGPEKCVAGSPLNWTSGVKVYAIQGTPGGSGWFDLTNWTTGSGGSWEYWVVNNGSLSTSTAAPGPCLVQAIIPEAGMPPAAAPAMPLPGALFNLCGRYLPASSCKSAAVEAVIVRRGWTAGIEIR